jgi:hypothetical protein
MKAIITALTAAGVLAMIVAPSIQADTIVERKLRQDSSVLHTQLIDEHTVDPAQEQLASYLEGVIRSWPPARIPMVDLTDLAGDIASVTLSETRVWPDDESGARTAVLLAALAYFEGARFAEYVDDGRCQEWGYAAFHKRPVSAEARKFLSFGPCDGGNAQSLWQVHAGEFEGVRYDMVSLRERLFAAHVALGIARRSMRATGTLRYYTGEWAGSSPKADERLKFALHEIHAHPMKELPQE